MAADPKYPCCTFRGSVSSLDAATGAVIWKSYTIRDEPKPTLKNKLGVQMSGPSGAAVWSSPTVDLENGMVFVTTGDSYSLPAAPTSDAFVAFEMKTGRLLWWRQTTAGDVFTVDCDFPEHMRGNCPAAHGPDHDFGSSPVLVTLGGARRALIAGQKSGVVHAVDPDRGGEVLWQRKVGNGGRLGRRPVGHRDRHRPRLRRSLRCTEIRHRRVTALCLAPVPSTHRASSARRRFGGDRPPHQSRSVSRRASRSVCRPR